MDKTDALPSVFCFLLPLTVSVLAWCRRRNVGVLTWMLRLAPIAAVVVCPFFGGWLGWIHGVRLPDH